MCRSNRANIIGRLESHQLNGKTRIGPVESYHSNNTTSIAPIKSHQFNRTSRSAPIESHQSHRNSRTTPIGCHRRTNRITPFNVVLATFFGSVDLFSRATTLDGLGLATWHTLIEQSNNRITSSTCTFRSWTWDASTDTPRKTRKKVWIGCDLADDNSPTSFYSWLRATTCGVPWYLIRLSACLTGVFFVLN